MVLPRLYILKPGSCFSKGSLEILKQFRYWNARTLREFRGDWAEEVKELRGWSSIE